MRAMAVFPGKPGSIHLADLPEPSVNDLPNGRGVLVEVLRVGATVVVGRVLGVTLLGLLGFLVVYMLNENEMVDVHMRPSFVALFAFLFAVTMGTLWEIFEFGMDELFGLTMQKPMLGDPSGLTDTMWDLILDTAGAAIVSLAGWRYLKRTRTAYLDRWATRFIQRNPQLFGR
jgi:hypothetical protein